MAAAIAFRESMGLRADEAYVRGVASDPAAISGDRSGYGVPLLPVEIRQLEDRPVVPDRVANVVEGYGERFPDEWAGRYVDNSTGGTIVGLFTARLEEHRTALIERLGADAAFRVEQARWSLRELTRLSDRVETDSAWFASLGLEPAEAGVDIASNVVRLRVATDQTDVADLTVNHFAAPGMLMVEVTGRRPWAGGHGRLIVDVIATDGAPFTQGDCVVESEDPAVSIEDGDRGLGQDGRCQFPAIPSTSVRVTILGELDRDVLAVIRTTVPVDDTKTLEVRLEE